jgi:hypothetical protein
MLGYSLAGMGAQQFAVNCPESVRRLILEVTVYLTGGLTPPALPARICARALAAHLPLTLPLACGCRRGGQAST